MFVRRIAIENVRSFLDRREIRFEGGISILIGPNGGGKTNLLDTLVIILKRYLFATRYPVHVHQGGGRYLWSLQENTNMHAMTLEKHSGAPDRDQVVEVDVEITQRDIDNMTTMRDGADALRAAVLKDWDADPWRGTADWRPEDIGIGDRFTYVWRNGALEIPGGKPAADFFAFVQLFEFDNSMRSDVGQAVLQLPMLYLPVNRAASGFTANVNLPGFNEADQRRTSDATTSRSTTNVIHLAVGRIARTYRRFQEQSNQDARDRLRGEPIHVELTRVLRSLGYTWDLKTVNADTNEFTIELTKQGSTFLVDAASSGEKEILTYLFAIYALNVRDALIIVDEPELHLHPRWQSTLLGLFEELSKTTGNQFVLATHSATFVSPETVQYVSRVYARDQKSDVVRLNPADLPNDKHLFNLINSHNNERIFFTDKVVLVEGLTDRIVFEKVLNEAWAEAGRSGRPPMEIVSVGGKGLFDAYKTLLTACRVNFALIADRDYVEQVGPPELKGLFRVNAQKIKDDVLENAKSLDGDALVLQIDTALETGSWDDAKATWDYIKSRRRMLKPDLNDEERAQLLAFLAVKREENIFILSQGALEAYLPEGQRGKNTEILIDFVANGPLTPRLEAAGLEEIGIIARRLLDLPDPPEGEAERP